MRSRDRRVTIVRRAVRIEPRVQLESTLVRLLDRERQRIPRRLRPSPLPPRDVLRPRLVRRRIQRIGPRPNMKHDRVHIERDGPVENGQQLALLFPGRQPGLRRPIDIPDRRDPHRPEFPVDRRRRLRACCLSRDCRGDQCPYSHAANLASRRSRSEAFASTAPRRDGRRAPSLSRRAPGAEASGSGCPEREPSAILPAVSAKLASGPAAGSPTRERFATTHPRARP
jgi:hypothetical protein